MTLRSLRDFLGVFNLCKELSERELFSDKFIAYGDEVYENFSRQLGGPVNYADHYNFIVLVTSADGYCE